MNKKLVAVAVAGLLAAPLAAQAQTANVTLYGRLNMTMEAVNGQAVDPNLPPGAAPVNRTIYRVNSNSSRIGVRGSESLGGGLSAIFQIEDGVNADISGGVHASRETFVGLQGTWGTFKIGRFLAPYDDIHAIFGNVPTLTTSILSTANLWAQGSQNIITDGGFDDREANSIRYDSPRIGGFTFSQQISAFDFSPASGGGGTTYGDLAQSKRHAYMGSTGGFYANGPFQAGIAYEWRQKVRGPSLNDYALSIAANWNFGPVKIGGVWERLDYDVLNNSDLTRNFYAISATVPLGPGELYALIGTARNGSGPTGARVGQLVGGSNTGADQWTISYTYALSKRTLAYAGFQQVRNDDNAAYNFNINPYTVVNGANANGFVLGLVHFF
jgi:predicted porin